MIYGTYKQKEQSSLLKFTPSIFVNSDKIIMSVL